MSIKEARAWANEQAQHGLVEDEINLTDFKLPKLVIKKLKINAVKRYNPRAFNCECSKEFRK